MILNSLCCFRVPFVFQSHAEEETLVSFWEFWDRRSIVQLADTKKNKPPLKFPLRRDKYLSYWASQGRVLRLILHVRLSWWPLTSQRLP